MVIAVEMTLDVQKLKKCLNEACPLFQGIHCQATFVVC